MPKPDVAAALRGGIAIFQGKGSPNLRSPLRTQLVDSQQSPKNSRVYSFFQDRPGNN